MGVGGLLGGGGFGGSWLSPGGRRGSAGGVGVCPGGCLPRGSA